MRKLQADEGIGVSGLVLLSPLLDSHDESGFANPMSWVDLLPSEVAAVRAKRGPVIRPDLADVEAYARGEYVTDILKGEHDLAATDRLTERVVALTGFDPVMVRRITGVWTSRCFSNWYRRAGSPASTTARSVAPTRHPACSAASSLTRYSAASRHR